MSSLLNILTTLQRRGFKETRVRKAIIDTLLNIKSPLSAPELQSLLKSKNIVANKSTIYREIAFLKDQRIVKEIHFGEDKKRYEIEGEDHHHHVFCIKCDRVEDIKLEQELTEEERKISQATNFKILNHSLEFFGLCKSCQ